MKPSLLAKLILFPLLGMAALSARADDIDLYAQTSTNSSPSNLLIILDNASAWNANQSFTCTGFTVPAGNVGKNAGFEQCGLYNAVTALGNTPALLGNLNLGLMYFPLGPSSGGTFVLPSPSPAPSALVNMNASGISQMQSTISNLSATGSNSNNNQIPQAFQEAWAFYQGKLGLSGTQYPGVTSAGANCGRNFVLYITLATTNTKPQDPGQNGLSALQTASGISPTPVIPLNAYPSASAKYQFSNSSGSQYSAPEWAKFMYSGTTADPSKVYPSITTYTIILKDGTNPDYEQYMSDMATAGGGTAFLVNVGDTSALVQAILAVFNEVQAVNSVFASPGLPVTSNAQGTYQNQIFLASFRPDGAGKPRWLGNLKQFQFGVDTSGLNTTPATGVSLFLGDASWGPYQPYKNANTALSSAGTGFISPNAISFWTTRDTTKAPDALGGFWVNKSGVGAGYDLVDGQYVEKGGVGQQIRVAQLQDTYSDGTTAQTTSRRLYTCLSSAGCGSGTVLSTAATTSPYATAFKTTNANLTATTLGITSPVYTASIGSISRTATQVTVNLTSTPSPAITNPATIVISGTTSSQFNGALSSASPTVSGSTITYNLPAELPAAPAGAYTANGTIAGSSNVNSLTRSTNAGWITTTATLADTTFGGGPSAALNDVISVTSSTGYNGSNYALTSVSGSTVKFVMQDSPAIYDGAAGKLSIGSTTCTTNGSSANCDTFDVTGSFATGTSGLIRGTNCTGCTAPAGQVLMVTFTAGTKIPIALGNTAYIAGSSNYNTLTGYKVIGIGVNCKVDVTTSSSGTVTSYSGIASTTGGNAKTFSVCLDLGASFAYSPSLTSNGATVGTTTASRPNPGLAKNVSSMVRAASTCPTSNLATTTVTVPSHGFSSGSTVTIGRSDGGPDEGYNGSFTISGVTTNTFTIQVPTTPACTDNKGSISYQSSANGGISATTLINWVRGLDGGDEPAPPDPASPALPITVRGSIHGDVLHSRPAVINYGGSTGVVVFYGANDGVFRAVNGNQPPPGTKPTAVPPSSAATYSPLGNCSLGSGCSIGGVPPGGELWGFIPTEFYPKLQRLYSNSPDVLLASTSTAIVPTPVPKDYFFDGPTATYQTFDSSGNTTGAYIFLTARRGGRLLYAFDVTTPTAPKLLWKHTNADTGFGELGQTWSQPKVALLRGYVDTTKPAPYPSKPVLIFGGGYDGNSYDATTSTTYLGHDDMDPPGTAAMGRGIFIVDAMTGALIWSSTPTGSGCPSGATCLATAAMSSSIASDITLTDTNFDGYVDRLYATDTGGNLWRVDLEKTTGSATAPYPPSSWQVTKLASLGGTVTTASPRKFLFAPDVVLTKNFAAVLAGTGDREHPLQVQSHAYNTVNRFYMILDNITGADSSGWTTVIDASDTSGASAPAQGTLFNATSTPFNITTSTCSATGGCKGYYLVLNQNAQSTTSGASKLGEQVVNAATTIGGYTYFGTNQPKPADPNSCSANLGNARAYKVGFLTGSGGFTLLDGGGLPPSPVAGLVQVDVNGTQTTVPFLLGGGGGATSGTIGGGTLENCTGPDCKSSLGGQKPPVPIPVKKKRTYWYRQIDQ